MFIDLFKSYGIPVLGGAVFLTVAWVFAYWSDKLVSQSLLRRAEIDPSFKPLIGRVIRYSIIVLAIIAVLDELGVEIASLVAALGIFGFAIAIGLRTTTNNFFTGVMLLILEPYKKGEYIEGERVEGVVETINMFHTVVATKDGVFVAVPNGAMWARSVRNYSRPRPHCVEIDVVVGHEKAFADLQTLIEEALAAEAMPLDGFEPLVRIVAVKNTTMTIRISVWCNAEHEYAFRKRVSSAIRGKLTAGGGVVRRIGAPRTVRPKKKSPPPAPIADEDT